MAPLSEPTELPADRALVFVGFMGAGKTTAARRLAKRFGIEVHDADATIAEHAGMPIDRCFAEFGEAGFRELEERLVGEALERAEGGVFSLGGGALHSPRIRAALARHTTVLLDVDVNTAWERAAGRGRRPLARDPQEFRDLYLRRRPIYMAAADAVVPADRRDRIDDALPSILALKDAPAGTRLLWATSASGDYPVFVGRDLLGTALSPVQGNGYLVTDDQVGPRYAAQLGDGLATTLTIPAGETHKTLQTAETVWVGLGEAGMTQGDHLVALGGGVVGDLAGFVAATYQRGVPIVQIPTTIVSQVDSAYGGKTGVDLPSAKNYVGAYHQPSSVVVDVETLKTLPREEAAAGYAEVVKTALIAGGHLWERVRSGDAPDADMIFECARTKLAVVAMDERDGGLRQVLNLGHTVGHAIETVTRYAMFRHGEAVGLGLLAALRLSGQDALRDEVATLLAAQGLPTQLVPGAVDLDAVLLATARDKKRRSGQAVPFVLLDGPGAARPGCQVGDADLRAAVVELEQARSATMTQSDRIAVLHGVNLDQLGRRDASHYGSLTLDGLERTITEQAGELGLRVQFFQTNFEGEFVEQLHKLDGMADGIILNPGAWTHYSWAIRDALEIARLPAVEVHLSNVYEREEWRQLSVIRDLCVATVAGKGPDGYRDALARLREELRSA